MYIAVPLMGPMGIQPRHSNQPGPGKCQDWCSKTCVAKARLSSAAPAQSCNVGAVIELFFDKNPKTKVVNCREIAAICRELPRFVSAIFSGWNSTVWNKSDPTFFWEINLMSSTLEISREQWETETCTAHCRDL